MKASLMLLVLSLVAWGSAAAQMHHESSSQDKACTFCAPWIFAEGGALYRGNPALPDATSDNWTPLLRAIVELGTPNRHVGLFAHLEIAPKDGATPTLTYGAQLWLLPRFSRFNLTGGVGLAHRRNGIGETRPGAFELRGWGQVGAEYLLPLHELSVYAEAGTPFSGAAKLSYQVGLRHPIAPWRAHLF
jgi:hypothetical protein